MFKQLGEILDNATVKNVSTLLWAAMLLNNPEYGEPGGLETVRTNLTFPQLQPALEACMRAFVSQLPKDTADKINAAANGEDTADPLATPVPTTDAK
jgi:hypothetical protein